MNYSQQKKKKFAYKAVVTKPSDQSSRDAKNFMNVEFPDDFKSLSQNSKRIKLDNGNKEDKNKDIIIVEENKNNDIIIVEDNDDLLPPEDLMDDDFDFTQAVDEIDQIEIAASQMVAAKPNLKQKSSYANKHGKQPPDIIDELLSTGTSKTLNQNGSQSTFYLKLPKKKSSSKEAVSGGDCLLTTTPVRNPIDKYSSEKRKYGTFNNTSAMLQNTSTVLQNDVRSQSKCETIQNELRIKKDNDNIELLHTYKTRMQEAEQKYLSKDGEIRILRETLRKLSEDERKYKDKIHELEYDLKTQQSEKEAKLLTEVEKLKTQLTFKEKEVQDALEQQKKITDNIVSSKTGPSHKKSPKVGFYSNAFEKSDKIYKIKSQHNQTIVEKTNVQCKSIKNFFARNIVNVSPSKEIIRKSSSNKVDLFIKDATFICKHSDEVTNKDNKNNNNAFSNILSSLEMIKHDHFFITEFVNKISYYTKLYIEMLTSQNTQISKQEADQITKFVNNNDNNVQRDCLICCGVYENCLKSLTVLSTTCSLYPVIKEYLLNGLVKFMGKEIKKPQVQENFVDIGGKKYFLKYPNLSGFVINKDIANIDKDHTLFCDDLTNIDIYDKGNILFSDYDAVIQLWSYLGELLNKDSSDEIEKTIFTFHISLISYPLRSASESHISYFSDNQLVPKHLNLMTADRILNVINLLQKFISLKTVISLMCSKSDRCPLLLIYNWLINEELQTNRNALIVFQELVSLLSSLIAYDQGVAYNFLLESNCRCSNEIIEWLITFLFDEFKHIQKNFYLSMEKELSSIEAARLSTFRNGMSLLYLLCCNEKNLCDKRSAVECNYIYLLAGTIRLYRNIPSINDKEVLDLEDLFDMDQYIDIDVPMEKIELDPLTPS